MNTIYRGAIFSPDKKHRYCLWRRWDFDLPMVMFVGLNPSRADHETDDPTIRRVQTFAKAWGFGGVYMLNLFSYITPYPEELIQDVQIHPENNAWLRRKAELSDRIIICCGSFQQAKERLVEVKEMLVEKKRLYCLGLNSDKSPKHPLYLAKKTRPKLFHQIKKSKKQLV